MAARQAGHCSHSCQSCSDVFGRLALARGSIPLCSVTDKLLTVHDSIKSPTVVVPAGANLVLTSSRETYDALPVGTQHL